MPADDVTVTGYFKNPTYQTAWAAAKAIIEAAVFELPQAAAGTQSDVRYRLAEMINELLRDVIPAQAGISYNPQGINGYFEFRVTPPETRSFAYNDPTTSNEQLTMNNYGRGCRTVRYMPADRRRANCGLSTTCMDNGYTTA